MSTSHPVHSALSRPSGWADAPKDFDWIERNLPCQAACPAGTDVPGYLAALARGDVAEAYRINLRDNIFPGVLGRICTRPCEPACRHGWPGQGEPVAICFAKRSAEALAAMEPVRLEPLFEPTGKRVVVVGAGVAGLTVARELALWGHRVTVLERHRQPGGMLVQAIPAFRLPRDVVGREIEQIRLTGVEIQCGCAVGRDVSLHELLDEAHAVVLAAGTQQPHYPDLPGRDLAGVEHGLHFLQRLSAGPPGRLDGRVLVIGGGFTAVDCARTARRLTEGPVGICARRRLQDLTLTGEEIAALEQEAVTLTGAVQPVGLIGDDRGRVRAVRCVRTRPGSPDRRGRRRAVAVAGSEFEIPAETVLLATGQQPETAWTAGLLPALPDPDNESTGPLFLAGDFALGATTLIDAIGHAKATARRVDRFLTGRDRLQDGILIQDIALPVVDRDAQARPRRPVATLPLAQRSLTAEVEQGLDADQARREAARCFWCQHKYEIDNDLCVYCNLCLKNAPVDGCIVKARDVQVDEAGRISAIEPATSNRDYRLLLIDQSRCIRCGLCAEVCPVECISVQEVRRVTRPVAATDIEEIPARGGGPVCPSSVGAV